MNLYLLEKFFTALTETYRLFYRTPTPKLIMTLLVKNEEAMLEQNLIFHKSMGVDFFIVTDNNSSDGTPKILQKYKQKGWILEIINETATNYEQKVWVDRMIWKAKKTYKADWIINADADEFWYSPSGNLKNELAKAHGNVQKCLLRNVYPEENKPFWQWNRVVFPVSDLEKYDLSVYSIFEKQNKKVAHRADTYIQISMGNHKVTMLPNISHYSKILIYHFTVRGRNAFIEKMVNGGKQLEQRKQRHGGRHWRYFYRLYKEGKLNEEYDRVIGTKYYDQLHKDGFIQTDTTLTQYFQNVLKYKPTSN